MLMMEELSPYRGNPKDSGVAIAFQDATLAWDAVSLPKEKRNTDRGPISPPKCIFGVTTQNLGIMVTCR
ncbi:hypothetical protein E2C01_063791 [Portunus trituberculatus]|uniref:Uncharacterized protein n=1 Tax=Portunus trituberculatus TaxID=210409 RepID=A0A5B7HHC0_PORTR|nr:hypothetical protein [Portunus trituberculatus]